MDHDLFKAAAKGNINRFISSADPLNLLLTPTNNTILHIYITARAKSGKSVEFVDKILEKCPTLLDQANKRGETPLHIASRYGHADIAKKIIERAKSQHQDLECGATATEILRKRNALNDTALHEAVRYNWLDVVRILTEADPHFRYSANDAGESPLYIAAERGYSDLVDKILETCSSIEYNGPGGRTALHDAAINNNEKMTRSLLNKNETLARKTDQQGWTPLHHAAYFGHLSIVKQLLDADKSAAYFRDNDGKTPLHIAARLGDSHVNVVDYFVSCCPDCCELVDDRDRNVLHFAVESCSSEGLRVLLRHPFISNLVNLKDNDGNTPLHLLAALQFNCATLIKHPIADKKAINNDNLTATDIVLATADQVKFGTSRAGTIRSLKMAGCKKSTRNKICLEDTSKKLKRVEGMMSKLERAKGDHLIVATLIATVTFAAGFTMPGGYSSEKGQDLGTAMLSKKAAFPIFLASDGLAFMVSTSVVIIHFLLAMQGNKRKFYLLFSLASFLIVIATVLMVVAFATGTFVVLPNSSSYRSITWVIVGIFFVMLICILNASLPLNLIKTGDVLSN